MDHVQLHNTFGHIYCIRTLSWFIVIVLIELHVCSSRAIVTLQHLK